MNLRTARGTVSSLTKARSNVANHVLKTNDDISIMQVNTLQLPMGTRAWAARSERRGAVVDVTSTSGSSELVDALEGLAASYIEGLDGTKFFDIFGDPELPVLRSALGRWSENVVGGRCRRRHPVRSFSRTVSP